MDARLSKAEIKHRYNQTTYSVKAASGTPYDCTQTDIDAFCRPPRNVRSTRFLPAEVSIQILTSFLSQQTPTPDVYDALARLRLAAWDPDWGPDIIIKALRDIDIAFFNSRLRGNVKVRWCNSSDEIVRKHLPRIPLGLSSSGERKGQCTVFLNADMIFAKRNPCKQMWRTTLHELVHAYLYVTTGGKVINCTTLYDDSRSFRKRHGWAFCWLLNHVHRRIKESLNIRLLPVYDRDRMFVRHEWELIYKDAIKLDRLTLERHIPIAGMVANVYWKMSSDSAIRQHTTNAYRWVTVSSQPGYYVAKIIEASHRESVVNSGGWRKLYYGFHGDSMSINIRIIYNTQSAVAANFYTH